MRRRKPKVVAESPAPSLDHRLCELLKRLAAEEALINMGKELEAKQPEGAK